MYISEHMLKKKARINDIEKFKIIGYSNNYSKYIEILPKKWFDQRQKNHEYIKSCQKHLHDCKEYYTKLELYGNTEDLLG